MPIYMFQGCYTSAAIAAMVKTPEDRTEVVRSAAEGLGGKLIGCWMAFGDYDYVGICEFPDSQAAAAFVMATSAGGSLENTKTVELIAFPDAIKAMKRASGVKYRPPGKTSK